LMSFTSWSRPFWTRREVSDTEVEQPHAHYEFVLADESGQPAGISAVLEMIRALWRGHRDRHEGGAISAPISQESAAAAVSLAVSLVQLLSTGAVRRKP